MISKKDIIYLTLLLLAAIPQAADGQNRVVVSKSNFRMVVVTPAGDTLLSCPVGIGANAGQKQKVGDCRTPEGTFTIASIEDASLWTHDFHDGQGQRQGAYGKWFIRLKVKGFRGIGIHGTCFPESVGKRGSEGCIRMLGDDLERLVTLVHPGDKVVVLPDVSTLP